ncbi:DUF2651 family protein [Bacillus sp. 179-C3.3 HS]|uniref:DUF2651 family protein n=1 Tax=Bacillus sp. 179-C3.3 HS TaxID=3232162 RepID=UPI0039A17CC9
MAIFILMVIFGFPMLSILVGVLGTLLFKNIWLPTTIVLLASLVLMFTFIEGDDSFLIWVICYTVFAFASALITKLVIKAAT